MGQKNNGRTAAKRAYRYYLSSLVVLLLSLDFILATYNPAYHPQGGSAIHHHPGGGYDEYSNQYPPPEHGYQQAVNWDGGYYPPRGGSTNTMVQSPPSEAPEMEVARQEEATAIVTEPYEPPKVQVKHMSMALRLTSEWNRRLLAGVNHFKRFLGKRGGAQQKTIQHHGQHQQQSLPYGSEPVNVHPSRAWQPPIQDGPAMPREDLTLFHAKTPRDDSLKSKQRRGVARWGPELEPFLEHVVEMLGSTDGVEIPLAMIYLDRACSVETPRSSNCPHCPFCTPRTVHRLSLASLLLAKQAVEGSNNIEEYYDKMESSLGIPKIQLQQMVEWMKGSLGDQGQYVTVDEMKAWGHNWDAIFFPEQHQQRLAYREEHTHHDHHHRQYHPPHEMEEAYPNIV